MYCTLKCRVLSLAPIASFKKPLPLIPQLSPKNQALSPQCLLPLPPPQALFVFLV